MERSNSKGRVSLPPAINLSSTMLVTLVLNLLLLLMIYCTVIASTATAEDLPNCSFPAIYTFGDSLTDVGNSIAAFPGQFAAAELDPQGVVFPTLHPADRLCDGKLLIDFLAYGIRRGPIYPVLRGVAADFTYGVGFAASGATARNSTGWTRGSGLHSPFSLDVQLEWLLRYKVRLGFYEMQNVYITVVQSLPTVQSLNSSLYMVYAGYQDYFFSLYDGTLTPSQTLAIVDSVVEAIVQLIKGILKFGGQNYLVVNLPPLGCIPAMLTLYTSASEAGYDTFGCLSELNEITDAHNALLQDQVVALRTQYPTAKFYYADVNAVYADILKEPTKFNVTSTLAACCGAGGEYSFNKNVTCGSAGMVEGQYVDLATLPPCANSKQHMSWDGIHTSDTVNRAVATALLTGEHITPPGGFNCTPDFTNF